MKSVVIRVRIDSETKEKYQKYTEQLGITMSEDIKLHIQQSLVKREADRKNIDDERYERFKNIYELLKDVYFDGYAELLKELEELECLI